MMGHAKDAMMEEEEMGWSPSSENFVCASCIEDKALAAIVNENFESKNCDFCGEKRRKNFAAPLDTITRHMAECIRQEYTFAEIELHYDNEDGEYFGDVFDTFDLLEDVGFDVANEKLFEEIRLSFSERDWCRREPMALSPEERKSAGWDNFKTAVKHKRRFTFWSMGDEWNEEYHPDYLPVGQMLAEIGELLRDARLIKLFSIKKGYWRVRPHAADISFSADHELSPPPIKLAVQANRMSPAGISMFYGAEDFETACYETVDPSSNGLVTGGLFKPLRKLRLLDLVDLPEIPSFFDEAASDARHSLGFLYGFVRDLAQPISRDSHEHIEYVPTQAFSEYVRFELKTKAGKPIDGIRYRSSKTGKPCVVFFCGQDECVSEPKNSLVEPWLSLDTASVRMVKIADLPPLATSGRSSK